MKNLLKKQPLALDMADESLVHSISVGLINQTTYFDGTLMAQKGYKNIVFKKGVVNGDTIYAKVKVVEKNDMKKTDKGEIVFNEEVTNQRGEVCSGDTLIRLIKKRNLTNV